MKHKVIYILYIFISAVTYILFLTYIYLCVSVWGGGVCITVTYRICY